MNSSGYREQVNQVLPVGHEPAGDSDGNGDKREEGGNDESNDEADLGDADLRVGR